MNRTERAQRQVEDRIYRLAVGGVPDTRWRRVLNCVTEDGYAAAAVRRRLGLPAPLMTQDRVMLEGDIFPYYCAASEFRKILFVGCAVFTAHYEEKFFAEKEFWTIEPEQSQAQFGATRHVVAPLEDAGGHFAPDYFDVIFCNGVYGWGLDTLAQGEAAFGACHSILRNGGHLVFGWNDLPARTPFNLADVQGRRVFNRLVFPPLQSSRYRTATMHKHVFDFYEKGRATLKEI